MGPEGDVYIASFTAEYYVQFMREWESRLNHYLKHGTALRNGELRTDHGRPQGNLFLRSGGSHGHAASRPRWAIATASPAGTGRPARSMPSRLWPPANVKITKGADNVGKYAKTPKSIRQWCKTCGGHLLTEHPAMGLTDVYAAILPKLAFKPGLHVFYEETVLHIHDGLPKQKDVPAELGGSGVMLAD